MAVVAEHVQLGDVASVIKAIGEVAKIGLSVYQLKLERDAQKEAEEEKERQAELQRAAEERRLAEAEILRKQGLTVTPEGKVIAPSTFPWTIVLVAGGGVAILALVLLLRK